MAHLYTNSFSDAGLSQQAAVLGPTEEHELAVQSNRAVAAACDNRLGFCRLAASLPAATYQPLHLWNQTAVAQKQTESSYGA